MAGQASPCPAQATGQRVYPGRYAHFVPPAIQQTMPMEGFAQIPNVKVMHAICAPQKPAGKPPSVPSAAMRALMKHRAFAKTRCDASATSSTVWPRGVLWACCRKKGVLYRRGGLRQSLGLSLTPDAPLVIPSYGRIKRAADRRDAARCVKTVSLLKHDRARQRKERRKRTKRGAVTARLAGRSAHWCAACHRKARVRRGGR